MKRKGSALIVAIWVIAVLSIMVLSFAMEARMQSGVNVFVRERNRVNRLMDAGQAIAEVVITGFSEATDWTDGEDLDSLLEDDRWMLEKRALKSDSKCTIGPILLDESRDENGDLMNPSLVKIEIQLVNAGTKNAINVNELYNGGDSNYRLRWEMILRSAGIPEDFEVDTKDGRMNLTDLLIASWNDWRDDDSSVTEIDSKACGAEAEWYTEYYDDEKTDDEDRRFPRNAAIPDIQELSYVRGWRDYPQVLTGGVLNPDERDDKEQIRVAGIINLLGVAGDAKINANDCTMEQLLTIPGIFNEDDLEDQDESREIAQAIVEALRVQPEDYEVDETRTWWPYKDFDDLSRRVSEYADVEVGSEAKQYLTYAPDANSVFKIKIIGESMGMTREVNAEGYVKDSKVRYTMWREN